jgi:hypothetical protein
MEFEFNCEHVTKADKSGYAIFSSEKLNTLPKKSYEYMGVLVDTMGKYSSKAQRLASVITSFKRLEGNTDRQKIYFYSQKNTCFGYLKTGFKKLFVSTEFGDIKEINPLCVLDFYVSEEVQRQGIGRKLFDLVLEDSGYKPEKIAYDRPSEKLLKFLSKHFGLKRYLPQNNSFVVFSQYFTAFSSKVKPTTIEDSKVQTSDYTGIYETKSKRANKEYDEASNVVNKDFIKNLIAGAHDTNKKVRRMAVNEESKDGFRLVNDVDHEEHNDDISELNCVPTDPQPVIHQSLIERTPLVDTTNDIKKNAYIYRNPITGDYYEDKPKVEQKTVIFDQPLVLETAYEPSGPQQYDDLISQKEAELQDIMERMSVSSKSSKRTAPTYQTPVETKPAGPVHGIPSLPNYSHNTNAYTASGMRSAQFHSTSPWATSE